MRNRFQNVQENLQAALNADGQELLEPIEQQAIEASLVNLSDLAKGDDKEAIKAAIEQVDKLSEAFAQRRMDQSIKRAFSGKSVDGL